MFPERRLRTVSKRLQRAREDLAVTDEQLVQFTDESDDARLRSLVADDPSAALDHTDSERHRSAMARHRQELVDTIARLEATQDELLDEMSERRRSSS